jgi:hypothetical protein
MTVATLLTEQIFRVFKKIVNSLSLMAEAWMERSDKSANRLGSGHAYYLE